MHMQVVNLTDLSDSFTTRLRGKEAYSSLSSALEPNTILVLNLDGGSILSTSFLDELLLGLDKDSRIDAMLFQTSDPQTRSRLERLSGTRSLRLRLLDSRGGVEGIHPRSIDPFMPKLVCCKPRSRTPETADSV